MLVENLHTSTGLLEEQADVFLPPQLAKAILGQEVQVLSIPETPQWYSVTDKYVDGVKLKYGEDVFSEAEIYKIDDFIAIGADFIEVDPGRTINQEDVKRLLVRKNMPTVIEFNRFFGSVDNYFKLASEQYRLNSDLAAVEEKAVWDNFYSDLHGGRLPRALFHTVKDPAKMTAHIEKRLESNNPNTGPDFSIPVELDKLSGLRRWAKYIVIEKASPKISVESRIRISTLERSRSFYAEVFSYDNSINLGNLQAIASDLGVREIIYRIRQMYLDKLRKLHLERQRAS